MKPRPLTNALLERLAGYRSTWGLEADGSAFTTHSSVLQPTRRGAAPTMLKIPLHEEERRGGQALVLFSGHAAVRVLETDGDAIAMERLADDQPLIPMAEAGRDDDATLILCAAVRRLHARQGPMPHDLPTLRGWFDALERQAGLGSAFQPLLAEAWFVARPMIETPDRTLLLHGDIHHGNVLHDPARGWAAIDPKGIVGARGYDYANMLCNPPGSIPRRPGRLKAQAQLVAAASEQTLEQVLAWVFAYVGLSASWHLEDPWSEPEEVLAFLRLVRDAWAAEAT